MRRTVTSRPWTLPRGSAPSLGGVIAAADFPPGVYHQPVGGSASGRRQGEADGACSRGDSADGGCSRDGTGCSSLRRCGWGESAGLAFALHNGSLRGEIAVFRKAQIKIKVAGLTAALLGLKSCDQTGKAQTRAKKGEAVFINADGSVDDGDPFLHRAGEEVHVDCRRQMDAGLPREPPARQQAGDGNDAKVRRARLHDLTKAQHAVFSVVGGNRLRQLFRVDGQREDGRVAGKIKLVFGHLFLLNSR